MQICACLRVCMDVSVYTGAPHHSASIDDSFWKFSFRLSKLTVVAARERKYPINDVGSSVYMHMYINIWICTYISACVYLYINLSIYEYVVGCP